MALITLPYTAQATAWPHQGRHIRAQFDAETGDPSTHRSSRIGATLKRIGGG